MFPVLGDDAPSLHLVQDGPAPKGTGCIRFSYGVQKGHCEKIKAWGVGLQQAEIRRSFEGKYDNR